MFTDYYVHKDMLELVNYTRIEDYELKYLCYTSNGVLRDFISRKRNANH